MKWREAFLAQARSDEKIRDLLNRQKAEYAHQLHYLQMVAEKLAKGFLTKPGSDDPPRATHVVFVSFLQALRSMPDISRKLGYSNHAAFRAFVKSLLPLAYQIERLAPASDDQPNPEYPWKPPHHAEVIVPSQYAFPEFDPRNPRMVLLTRLIQGLLQLN